MVCNCVKCVFHVDRHIILKLKVKPRRWMIKYGCNLKMMYQMSNLSKNMSSALENTPQQKLEWLSEVHALSDFLLLSNIEKQTLFNHYVCSTHFIPECHLKPWNQKVNFWPQFKSLTWYGIVMSCHNLPCERFESFDMKTKSRSRIIKLPQLSTQHLNVCHLSKWIYCQKLKFCQFSFAFWK